MFMFVIRGDNSLLHNREPEATIKSELSELAETQVMANRVGSRGRRRKSL